jgi:hypothetical protein
MLLMLCAKFILMVAAQRMRHVWFDNCCLRYVPNLYLLIIAYTSTKLILMVDAYDLRQVLFNDCYSNYASDFIFLISPKIRLTFIDEFCSHYSYHQSSLYWWLLTIRAMFVLTIIYVLCHVCIDDYLRFVSRLYWWIFTFCVTFVLMISYVLCHVCIDDFLRFVSRLSWFVFK